MIPPLEYPKHHVVKPKLINRDEEEEELKTPRRYTKPSDSDGGDENASGTDSTIKRSGVEPIAFKQPDEDDGHQTNHREHERVVERLVHLTRQR
jgi:hypothetical protein